MAHTARGLILFVLDTLRSDYERLCSEFGVLHPNLDRLRQLAGSSLTAVCGSFPTGPMRTDLLTGRLAFLSGEWNKPAPGEETLLKLCRTSNIWTTLVTDNYVAVIPRIGGMLINEFDNMHFIRGAGSDPFWTPTPHQLSSAILAAELRPTRSPIFEAQFIANASQWSACGGSPTKRLVSAACAHLELLISHNRFLLWVDSFAFHEPWLPLTALGDFSSVPAEQVVFPAYEETHVYKKADLQLLRKQYTARIGKADSELKPLVDALENVIPSGDVALIVVSDHGFLLGEYGYVGKPACTPIPPELHELVLWVSPHLTPFLSKFSEVDLQPHILHYVIRNALCLPETRPPRYNIALLGRNSPRSNYLAVRNKDWFYWLENGTHPHAQSIRIDALDPTRPLANQGNAGLPTSIEGDIAAVLENAVDPWTKSFLEIVSHKGNHVID